MATAWIIMKEVTYYKDLTPGRIEYVSADPIEVYDECEKAFKALNEIERTCDESYGGRNRIIDGRLVHVFHWVCPPKEIK